MSANSAIKRERRILKRCIPAVAAALGSGQISARSADVFLKLSRKEQKAELDRRLKAIEDRERISEIVAETIRGYLNALDGRRPDLNELNGKIAKALQPAAGAF